MSSKWSKPLHSFKNSNFNLVNGKSFVFKQTDFKICTKHYILDFQSAFDQAINIYSQICLLTLNNFDTIRYGCFDNKGR